MKANQTTGRKELEKQDNPFPGRDAAFGRLSCVRLRQSGPGAGLHAGTHPDSHAGAHPCAHAGAGDDAGR